MNEDCAFRIYGRPEFQSLAVVVVWSEDAGKLGPAVAEATPEIEADEIVLDVAASDGAAKAEGDEIVLDVAAFEAAPGAGAAEVVPHTEAFAFAPDAEGVEAGPDAEGAEGAEVAPAAEADEIVLDVAAFAFAPDAEDDTVLAGEPVEIASDTEAVDAAPAAEAVLDHKAEPGDGEHFLHQWDITPQVKAELDGYGDVAFIRHDTRMRASVPVETLKGYLTPERQTTRGEGNWGVRILVGHEDELAFEPGPGGGEWVMLPVEWSDQ